MIKPPEHTTDRLNRELNRLRYGDLGFWGGWALLIGIAVILAFVMANKPRETRYVTGIASASAPTASETGLVIKTTITVEDRTRIINLPSQLVHPAKGETICLRAGEHRITGHTSYVIVSKTFCDGPTATQDVE